MDLVYWCIVEILLSVRNDDEARDVLLKNWHIFHGFSIVAKVLHNIHQADISAHDASKEANQENDAILHQSPIATS